jgi:hypothetical protein
MNRRDFLVRGTSLCGVAVGVFLFRPLGRVKKPPPKTMTTTRATTIVPSTTTVARTTTTAAPGSTYAGVYARTY